ncbi:MAG: hypothetical protein M1546_06195 [Chloroflexi bacterium]|nr:hypothetical protein [Chloroflexota bacterium]
MNKTRSIVLNLLAAAGLLLAACGGEPASPTADLPTAPPPTVAEETSQPAKGDAVEVEATEPVEATEAVEVTEAVEATDEPAPEATQASASGDSAGDATYVADLGFRPQSNGFNFPNYGGEPNVVNLTPAEMRRMFGDQVCARIEGDECTLTPPAQEWMEQNNDGMSGGHCEGMAALSLLMYGGKIDPAQFGGENASSLPFDNNEALQREIAYWFVTQATLPAADTIFKGTPAEIVEKLIEAYKDGNSAETYAVGVYKPDRSGGHAVAAYGVQDKGNGVYWIMVYDNNSPGEERYIEVDTNANTWQFEASPNPSIESEIYQGDADTNTLEIAPSSSRLEKQVCTFCDEATGKAGDSLAQAAPRYNEIWMDGNANLLLTDDAGNKLGMQGGTFYNEIPKAQVSFIKGGNLNEDDVPPLYRLPAGMGFSAVIDGDNLKSPDDPTELAMIGPGYYIGVESIEMDPGERDYLTFSGDGRSISYKTDYTETPAIIVGLERPQADYELELMGTDIEAGSEVKVDLDPDKGTMTFYSTSAQTSKFSLVISRIDDEETESFEGDELELDPTDKIILDYGEWSGNGKSLKVMYDQGGDGVIDETADMADEK